MKTANKVPAGSLDPVAVASAVLAATGESEFLLFESGNTFRIAVGVKNRVVVERDAIECTDDGGTRRAACADPFAEVPTALAGTEAQAAYGYVAFDAAHAHLPYRKHAPYPSVHLVVPNVELVFDGTTLTVNASESPETLLSAALVAKPFAMRAPSGLEIEDATEEPKFTPRLVAALDAIRAGRFEKVIVSRAVSFPGELDVLATHANARRAGASRRFAFRLGRVSGVGSSPSPVLVSNGRQVSTLPLAGTRPRGDGDEADEQLRKELFADPKEVREHAMSVRRALSELRDVCTPESVVVSDFMGVVRYRFTQHLASRVQGDIAEGKTSWDALRAVFPAVTVTGVEKEPAVAFIDEIEDVPRGVYGGAVGVFGPGGQIDTGLAIRSVFGEEGRIVFNAGAGVVAESETGFEFRESRDKMRTMLVNVVVDPPR
jgi:salicylate synthetase